VPWIHLADEVAAIRFLLEHPDAAGPFDLAAPEPVTHAELSRTLARVLHRPALFRVPAFAARLVLGEMADVVLTGRRALPRRLGELGFAWRYPELEEALKDLLS
jgi:NAD dependent epimerase/dehydratase family enzyme